MQKLLPVLTAAFVLILGASLHAQTTLTANITNGQEPGNIMPTTSAGAPRTSSGEATFILSPTMDSLTFTATVLGVDLTGQQTPNDPNDNLVAAHIHASSDPNFMPPTNAGVVWGFFGTPFNETAPNDQVVTPLVGGVGGTFSGKWDLTEGNNTTLTAQIPNILAGRAYINFHTTQFGGGEMRGAIIAIPEPSTIALALLGLSGLTLLNLRSRATRKA